jgi:hypothetical protein
MTSEILLKDPFYLDCNSVGQKTLFFTLFTFRYLRELKRIWDFSTQVFSKIEDLENLGLTSRAKRAKRRQVAHPYTLVGPPMLFRASRIRYR